MDGPGNRVVLFLQGCHLRCPWCHSPHSWELVSPLLWNAARCIGCYRCIEVCEHAVHYIAEGIHQLHRDQCIRCGKCVEACPTSKRGQLAGALALPTQEADPSTVFHMLLPQLDVVRECGGLTISGGEALLQKEAVLELLQLCKQHHIHTALETSLTLPWEMYASVENDVDCWLVGMRDLSVQGYPAEADERVSQNVQHLAMSGKEVIVRLPLIHGYTDMPDRITRMIDLMRFGHFDSIELLPCNPDLEHYYVLSGIEPIPSVVELLPSAHEVEIIADCFRQAGFKVKVIT